MKRRDMERREGSFSAPLPGAPNVRFRVPTKPLRFKLWGAHEDISLPSLLSQRSQCLARQTQGTGDTRFYTGSGHRCGVIAYSSVVWWIASWAKDELVQWMNNLLRGGVLELDELVCLRMVQMTRPRMSRSLTTVVSSPIYRGPGPLPKCLGRKGSQTDNLKGDK